MARNSLSARLSAALAASGLVAMAACSDVSTSSAPGMAPADPAASQASAADDDVVAGEVIVKLKDGGDVDALVQRHGVAKGRQGYLHAFDVVHTTRGNERSMAARLSADPAVEYAEPNYIRHVDAIDSRLWAFYNPTG